MNQILYSGKKNNKPTVLIASIAGIALLIVILFGFAIINMFNHKILSGVFAANIDVSNMTKEEAVEAISKKYNKTLPKNLVLTYEDQEMTIETKDIGVEFTDADGLAEKAYNYGREDNIIVNNFIVLKSYFNGEKRIEIEEFVDDNKLMNAISNAIREDGIIIAGDSYKVSGDKLLLTKGTTGKKIDFNTLKARILEALKENETVVEIPVVNAETEPLDIELVHKQVYKEPVNASYKDGESLEIISEENGVDFDINEAKEKYAKLAKGETAEIDLKVIEPKVKVVDLGDALFKNVIATYSAKYTNTSLESVATKCNDLVVNSDEDFSFKNATGNGVTGEYTQMASILYNAVLRADLKVIERKANSTWVQYIPQSTDALINETTDFVFNNNRKYPIKLVTSCANGICTVSIYGIKDKNDYTIDVETKVLETIEYTTEKQNDSTLTKGKVKIVQNPINGYVSEAYKVYYKDGAEVSRKLISKDRYEAVGEIIKVGTRVVKKQTTTVQTPAVTPAPAPQTPYVDPNFVLPTGWDVPESGY